MKPELVIFDMDGLMFDTERVYYEAWQKAAKAYNYHITWSIYMQIAARNSRYIKKVLTQIFGEDFPCEEVIRKKRALSDEIIEEEGLRVKKGLYKLLKELEEKNIKKAVATSSTREKTMRYLQKGEVEQCFDYVICGDDVKESKPNPEIFLKVAQALNCAPEKCFVLEDSKFGLQAAKQGGMLPILVPDFIEIDDEMRTNAYRVVASLEDVTELIAI